MNKVNLVCSRDCPDGCHLIATIDNGKVISTKGNKKHPVTRGILCPRGKSDAKRIYSTDRLLFPQIRTGAKPGYYFNSSIMNDIIPLIVDRLQTTIQKYGPESVLLLDYSGNTGLFSFHFSQRFWNAIGAAQTDHALCSSSGHAALALHYGLSYGIPAEELVHKKVIVFWGFNAKYSSMHIWNMALKARQENNAIIVAIDPRRSETADAADIWLRPQPNCDAALTYGIAKYLIENNCVDKHFIENWTYGFEYYKKEVLRWSPEKVEHETGIPQDQFIALAKLFTDKKSVAFMIGLGSQKNINGAEIVRGVCLLPALLGQHRGFYYTNTRGYLIDWGFLNGTSLTKNKSKFVKQVELAKQLEAGEFKFIFIKGMNPAASLPGQRTVRAGFSRKDVFIVVHETHRTETCDYADILLPAATYFEKDDIIVSESHPYVQFNSKAIKPLGESQSEVNIMQQLARQMNLKEQWLFSDPIEAAWHALSKALDNYSYNDLINGSLLKLKSHPVENYQTISGRIEFYSQKAIESGVNPLPQASSLKQKKDELILLTSSIPNYTHSQFQDVYGPIPQIIWLNIEDANLHNIKNGDQIILYNDLGSLVVIALITDRVKQGVCWSPKFLNDLENIPQNELVSPVSQQIGNGPVFNSTSVKIQKIH